LSLQRRGDDFTRPFTRVLGHDEQEQVYCEELAQAFVNLVANIDPNDGIRELQIKVDDAISDLIMAIYRRAT
jgi:hypothetical protein